VPSRAAGFTARRVAAHGPFRAPGNADDGWPHCLQSRSRYAVVCAELPAGGNRGMNTNLETFLSTRLPFPGLAGWGVRCQSQAIEPKACVRQLTPDRIDQLMTCLALGAETVRGHDLKPQLMCWKFEQVQLFWAMRTDGTSLALVVE